MKIDESRFFDGAMIDYNSDTGKFYYAMGLFNFNGAVDWA